MAHKKPSACSYFVALAVLAFAGFQILNVIRGLQNPRAVEKLVETVEATGICFGICFAALAAFTVVAVVSAREPRRLFHMLGRSHPARCHLLVPGRIEQQAESFGYQDSAALEPGVRVCILISSCAGGLRLADIKPEYSWSSIPSDNSTRYRSLTGGSSAPIILPTGYYTLYFAYSSKTEYPVLRMRTGPANAPGYSGRIPKTIREDGIEILLAYTATMEEEPGSDILHRCAERTLNLVLLTEEGRDDVSSTRDFYNAVWDELASIAEAEAAAYY